MPSTWTPVELIRWTAGYLEEKGFSDARLNAELLLAGVLGLRRLDLYLQFERILTADELAEYKSRLKRRVQHEPLQYIAGTCQFRELELRVDRRVLIPRPETERLVEEVLTWAAGRSGLEVVDIGTGSGAIALSLGKEGEFGRVIGTDVSDDALQVARQNRDNAGLGAKVELRGGSLYQPIKGEQFDIVVSNPPYVATGEAAELATEVADWEPSTALFAGDDGLDVIRQLVDGAPDVLRSGGLLAMEIGASQGDKVAALLRQSSSFRDVACKRDLTGRDRFVLAERV